jgi:hypothetical protein
MGEGGGGDVPRGGGSCEGAGIRQVEEDSGSLGRGAVGAAWHTRPLPHHRSGCLSVRNGYPRPGSESSPTSGFSPPEDPPTSQ